MSKPKAKGTAAETAVARYARANTPWDWQRRAAAGRLDKGDVWSPQLPSTIIEVKDCARTELAKWVDEAEVEAVNAQASLGVVVHKRRRKGNPGEWYCSLAFADFLWLLKEAYE